MESFKGTGYSKIIEQLEEARKGSVFAGAKFGDKFKTSTGELAVYLGVEGAGSMDAEHYLVKEDSVSSVEDGYIEVMYCSNSGECTNEYSSIVSKVSSAAE